MPHIVLTVRAEVADPRPTDQHRTFAPSAHAFTTSAPVRMPESSNTSISPPTVAALSGNTSSRPTGHGSLLCQDAAGSLVLGLRVTGPGSDLSEEPVWGCEPVALDVSVVPRCPPGLVALFATRSSSMVL